MNTAITANSVNTKIVSGFMPAAVAALGSVQLVAMAKVKPSLCAVRYVWRARSKRGRWLG